MGVDTENRLPSLKRMHIVGDTGYTYTESSVACGAVTYARLIYYALYRSFFTYLKCCLLYTSPSPRDATLSRMPSSA